MKRPLHLFAACWLLWALAGSLHAEPPAPLRDADGRPVVATPPATRLASTAPSLTELVYTAGAGDMLVGVSAYSDYPASAQSLPVVADAAGIAFESLLALHPDLVLTWKSGTRESDVQRLQALGIRVFAVEVVQLDDVPRALRAIGQLTGHSVSADAGAEQFQRRVDALRAAAKHKSPVRTFFELSAQPLMTVNGHHFIAEAMRLCGGENVFETAPQTVFTPSREALLARGADLILYARGRDGGRDADRSAYAGLAAARNNLILPLTADYILRPGPRLLQGVGEVCTAIDAARVRLAPRP